MADDAPVTPLTIGSHNCETAIGLRWRYVRDWARAHGVPILCIGAKSVIPAAPLLAALEREGFRRVPEPELDARAELVRRLSS